jgi:hypothetical protein
VLNQKKVKMCRAAREKKPVGSLVVVLKRRTIDGVIFFLLKSLERNVSLFPLPTIEPTFGNCLGLFFLVS